MTRDSSPDGGRQGSSVGFLSDERVVLRAAAVGDVEAIAQVWIDSFTAALPDVRRAHDDAAVTEWFRSVVLPEQGAWVAEADGVVVGVLVLDGDDLSQLYLSPAWRGRGIGDRFIALAKALRPGRLELRTFQMNTPARRFYERHGFVLTGTTSGAGNEEREPDAHYVWTAPPQP